MKWKQKSVAWVLAVVMVMSSMQVPMSRVQAEEMETETEGMVCEVETDAEQTICEMVSVESEVDSKEETSSLCEDGTQESSLVELNEEVLQERTQITQDEEQSWESTQMELSEDQSQENIKTEAIEEQSQELTEQVEEKSEILDENVDSYQEAINAYRKFLSTSTIEWSDKSYASDSFSFMIEDINLDGIPELFLQANSNVSHYEGYEAVYYYYNHQVVQIWKADDIGEYYPQIGIVSFYHFGMGGATWLYQIPKNGKAWLIGSGGNYDDPMQETYYEWAGATVSEEEFKKHTEGTVKIEINAEDWLPNTDDNRERMEELARGKIVAIGRCGENANFVLNRDGVLTISGSGSLGFYDGLDLPEWIDYVMDIKKIVIQEGITGLGWKAFMNCENLTDVKLSSTVESLGVRTFAGCRNLINIDIPEGVTCLNTFVFTSCGFKEIKIPSSLTDLRDHAFSYCTNLTEIALPRNVANVEWGAFTGCKNLQKIIFYNSDCTICDYDGSDTIPENTTIYGYDDSTAQAYAEKYNRKFVLIGEEPTEIISGKCGINVKFVLNSDGVLTISGSGEMDNYIIGDDTPWSKYNDKIKSVIIMDDITSIGNSAFSGCQNLRRVKVSSGLTRIGESAFRFCLSLENIEIPTTVTELGAEIFRGCGNLHDVKIPSGITKIQYGTFRDCNSLEYMEIPSNVVNIGNGAFGDCEGLKSIKILNADCIISDDFITPPDGNILYGYAIPDNATIYGYDDSTAQAYAEKYNRKFVSLGTASDVFSGSCGDTLTWVLNKDGALVISGIGNMWDFDADKNPAPWFENNNQIKYIVVEEGVTTIGSYAFAFCGNAWGVNIANTVITVGSYAFYNCVELKEFSSKNWEPSKSATINEAAFYGCAGLKSLSIPNNVVSLGALCFYECYSLEGVLISENIQTIGPEAFYRCMSLKSVTILSEITTTVATIGSKAFWNCTDLEIILIPKSVVSIGNDAFLGCKKLVIYGYSDSYAQTYATKNDIKFIILDDEEQETGSGFNLKNDGHCVINAVSSFSYDSWTNWFGIAGYKIPLERYQEVYGESYTKHIYDQNISVWGGNCFGMSATAVLFYKGKLAISEYIHGGNTITSDGYDDMASSGNQVYLRLKSNSDLTKLIERYQIWHEESDEFAQSRVKDIINYGIGTNAEIFSGVLTKIESTKEPFLVSVHWKDSKGSDVGHALVVDSSRSPKSLGNGWVRIYLYDPNNPYFKNFGNKTPVSAYSQAENRYVDVNIESGQWKMAAMVNGSWSSTASIGYDDNGNEIEGSSISFRDVNDYPIEFDKKATFSSSEDAEKIAYASNNFEVYDADNRLLYKMADGHVSYINNNIVYDITDCGYIEGIENQISSGSLILPKGQYSVVVDSGSIAYLTENDYAGIVAKNKATVSNINSTALSVSSASSAEVNVVIEDVRNNEYTSIETDLQIDDSGCEISLQGKKLELDINNKQNIDISVITKDGESQIKDIDVLSNKTNYIDLNDDSTDDDSKEDDDKIGDILPEDIPADGKIPDGLWIAGIRTYTYTGKPIKPEVRVYDSNRLLKVGQDYTITYKNNTKANNASNESTAPVVIVKGKGNYTGIEKQTFKILPLNINDTSITTDDITVAYNKKVQKKVPVVTYKGKKLAKNKDFTVSYPSQGTDAYKSAGTYTILLTAKQNGNFTGTRTVQFTITNNTLISSATVKKIANQTYTGKAIEPALEVTMKKVPLMKNTDYTVTYDNNIQTGTATVILTGIGRYAGTKKVTFKINGTSIKGAVVSGITDRVYNGTAQEQKITVALNNKKLTEETDYKVVYSKNVNAGNATVTINGINAYSGTVKKTFKITAYDLEENTGRAIGGLDKEIKTKYLKGGSKPKLELTFAGRKLAEGTDYTVSYQHNRSVTAAGIKNKPFISVKGKGNFKGNLTKTFTITGKALNDAESPVTLTVADKGFMDKPGKYVSVPILTDADGKKLVAGKDYEKTVIYTLEDGTVLAKNSKVNAGTKVKVKVTGKGAYIGQLEGIYQIKQNDFNKAKISIEPQTYTGKVVTLDKNSITVKIGSETLISGTDYEIVKNSYTNNVKKGTASVTIVGKGNYGGTKTVKFKITARKLSWFWRLFG